MSKQTDVERRRKNKKKKVLNAIKKDKKTVDVSGLTLRKKF